ncbi:DegT/DnrJ/EryC1/StrS family aminotransferase [Pseudomonadota bacterium]
MQQINDLSAKVSTHETQIRLCIDRVLASGWLVLGPEVKHFEQLFASYLDINHCVGLANGTDALELSLRAMGVTRGDCVATVANAGMYTTTALSAIGAEPFFMDVDPDTKGATLAEVIRAVDSVVKAVVVTHLFGQAIPDIEQISEYCSINEIPLLEDCAQAHGARVNGRCVGTFGDAASFSFYPTKNLGALGDGGAVVTQNADLAKMVISLRQYGWTEKYKVEVAGARNSRLDELQAAILSGLLPSLDESNERRRDIAARYSSLIKHPHITVPKVSGADYVAHLYVIRCKQRDSLREHLRAHGIASDVHYPVPDYRQPVFGKKFADTSLPNTEVLVSEILTLPCYPELSVKQVDLIIAAVNGWGV